MSEPVVDSYIKLGAIVVLKNASVYESHFYDIARAVITDIRDATDEEKPSYPDNKVYKVGVSGNRKPLANEEVGPIEYTVSSNDIAPLRLVHNTSIPVGSSVSVKNPSLYERYFYNITKAVLNGARYAEDSEAHLYPDNNVYTLLMTGPRKSENGNIVVELNVNIDDIALSV
jgi:hypothetical protein